MGSCSTYGCTWHEKAGVCNLLVETIPSLSPALFLHVVEMNWDDDHANTQEHERNDSVLRATCSEAVSAFAVCSSMAVWCTLQSSIYLWKPNWGQPVLVGRSDFIIRLVKVNEEGNLFVMDDNHFVVHCVVEEDGHVFLKNLVAYSYNFGSVLHMSVSPDGAVAALSSKSHLILVDCRSLDSCDGSPITLISCMDWVNERGCALTVFASSERLFIVSAANHLVAVQLDPSTQSIQLERDGHVITRAHNVTCLAASSVKDSLLVVGLSDGTIKLIQMDTLDVYRTVDIEAYLEKIIQSQSDDPSDDSEVRFQAFICDISVGSQYITVCMPDAAVVVNRHSLAFEDERTHFFQGAIEGSSDGADDNSLSALCSSNGSWFSVDSLSGELQYFVSPSAFRSWEPSQNDDNVVRLHAKIPEQWLQRMVLDTCDKVDKKSVTFGHAIKSSGYTDRPYSEKQKQLKAAQRQKPAVEPTARMLEPYERYPLKPLSSANRILSSAGVLHSSAITSAVFSSIGSSLITGSSDSTLYNLKYPIPKHNGDGNFMKGHSGTVLSVDTNLSLKTQLVLSSSTDGTVRIWSPGKREGPILTHTVPGTKEVCSARFIYTDKFVAYTTKNAVEVCKFVLDFGGGELERARNKSAFSDPLSRMAIDGKYITAMECINHFRSTLLVVASSNKCLDIFDFATQQLVMRMQDAHSRAIHHIAMATNSRFVQCSPAAEHSFLTAGLDNAVNLWDLRQPKGAVRQFGLHKNSALTTLGLSISPSGNFFAVGSEDRSVFIYDVRFGGSSLDVLPCNDVPTAVAWHPTDPVLAVGSSCGSMQLFGQR